jgi:signal transduction histidine kinase
MLAHELRNLASPIRNAVQLLQMCGPPEPRLIRAREVIDRQVRHQARLIDDLLDISRISQGKIELRRERLDLVELVRNTVEDRRGILDDARLDLALKLPAEPVWVTGDPTRLCQVVGNLIQNATKFTETGGRVSVRVVANDALAAIIVADTGIGIDPEIMPHVFEMFAQARGRADGLGLGLTLVRGLVELHQGEVHLSSDGPGRGTEVVVSLPRDRGS